MTLSKRIIARLDVKGTKLIKGIRFEGLRVLGESYEAAFNYYESGIDEILYIDSVASLYGRSSLNEILKITSENVFIPITAGGGIRSVEDAGILLTSGADKIAINSACIEKPELISEIAEKFGTQCVVVSIQARKDPILNNWTCMYENAKEKSNIAMDNWIKTVQELGAGEILLTSVDQDGTCKGPDNELIDKACKVCKIPLIVGGGISKIEHIDRCIQNDVVTGISLAAALHKNKLDIFNIKKELKKKNISIRSNSLSNFKKMPDRFSNIRIGIVDYMMGNQHSLINSLRSLGIETVLTSSKKILKEVDLIMLPGVGAFPTGISNLRKLDVFDFLIERAQQGQPIIGICLGMQMLFESSSEFELTSGLNLIEGKVEKFNLEENKNNLKMLPHVGWNSLICKDSRYKIFDKINQYFVHSYIALSVPQKYIIFKCDYAGENFIAAINKKNITGFQFHPERSGLDGLHLLSNEILRLTTK